MYGYTYHPLYDTYRAMIKRCCSPSHFAYKNYGARGITVCDRWLPYGHSSHDGFVSFLEDMGPRPTNHSLDRINNDGNYEPDNCKWSTRTQQQRNRRSGSRSGKLTESDIPRIFEMRSFGLTQKAIADQLGVTSSMIGCILRGQSWRSESSASIKELRSNGR